MSKEIGTNKCDCGIYPLTWVCDGSCEAQISPEKERVDGYLATITRLEPDIHPVDASAFYTSAAISLKRIADAAEKLVDRFPPLTPVHLDRVHLTNDQLIQISKAIGRQVFTTKV